MVSLKKMGRMAVATTAHDFKGHALKHKGGNVTKCGLAVTGVSYQSKWHPELITCPLCKES
jgi:hypothetical protein